MIHEILIAGFGGQGVMSMGQLLAHAGLLEGREVSWLPSYGPEMRGGTAFCSVIIADEPVGSPVITDPSCLMVLNRPSLDKFINTVQPGGIVFVNSSLIDVKVTRTDVKVYYIACNELAAELGNAKVGNIIMLGAFIALTKAVAPEHILTSLSTVLHGKQNLIAVNAKALEKGEELVRE